MIENCGGTAFIHAERPTTTVQLHRNGHWRSSLKFDASVSPGRFGAGALLRVNNASDRDDVEFLQHLSCKNCQLLNARDVKFGVFARFVDGMELALT